ncbi:enoyl-CoA hydratase/isomerase family protein [Rhodococcus sp. 06-156-3C]|uniref:enoyl-CoA hydratase/isomerase family protein n=1 Tax=Nocardiaceae TaxID=85025 RepID=UPI000522FC8F|nr:MULTISPECIES: enoyl-CoA hydratase/isomerase family protein [Rhodococcus]OZD13043.1 enoyl-CoA hydratase/isomerase family protein [Rhodococcus sp. 06-156-4a]OZD17912.1 enoyl-CoA hydratase/isomerase family protein [Rhodococcus sp. 06-156-3C]OZD20636.1 enoyl-CoA hydratase/isomerase family protein [Rhodococcus sp. 06-156-4C]OZD30646.1 enoyl-CoA hydratase/isomerase family protein [Rhodococcus sp. 06-156-3b]OZD32582.1 enoyl-CoA hydratase/isomerase family protein [Rhodococcus sp. 06-156-3]
MTVHTDFVDGIAILNLGDDENRFSVSWIEYVNDSLDRIDAGDAQALVTTGTGKFYSNGLDLEWVLAHPDKAEWYIDRVHAIFARILTAPVPTAASVNGHAFGAGAMFAIAHDYRIMREDRGYFCFPEIDIDVPFTPGMSALIQSKLSSRTAIEAMTTGHRYGGPQALSAGLADALAAEGTTTDAAVRKVEAVMGKTPATMRAIKKTMFADVLEALTDKDT